MEKLNLTKVIQGCVKNDRKAQEQLYKQYFALMYHISKDYETEREEILSIINAGFLKIFMNIASFDETRGSFETWAKRVITNHCIDHVRKKRSTSKLTQIEEVPEAQKPSIPAPEPIEDEILFHLKKLPATTQKVFSMHIFKGFSHKEIARELDMAESTSRWHILEARKVLKKVAHKIL